MLLAASAVLAQDRPVDAQAAPSTSAFTIFVRGTAVGREELTVVTDASGTTMTSRNRLAAPLSSVVELAVLQYAPDWTPRSFVLESTSPVGPVSSRTTFERGTAVTEGASAGAPVSASHEIAPQAVVLPNGVFGAYQAVASRLRNAPVGAELQAYIVPTTPVDIRVAAVHDEQMQQGTTLFDVRRYELTFSIPGGGASTVYVTAATDASLLRVSIPDQEIDVVRSDIAAASSRAQIHSNPGDEAVFIPAEGFNLGATLTRPASATGRLPAVILLGDAEINDRDGFAAGVPVYGQLAGALAGKGFLVVRYDKRGHAQSGGRSESATLSDYANDARAVVRWLRDRDDVDRDRIAVVGHGEGAWIGLLTTSREGRIAAVVSLAGASSTGAELKLEQQQRALDRLNLPPVERTRRIELQKQIQDAVMTGKGWESLAPEVRRTADTPLFQSVLLFEPARVIDGIRQPVLIVHPELDRQVPVAHADRLAALARRSRSVGVVIVRGVNHLLVPGEIDEHGAVADRNISTDVVTAVGDWLIEEMPAR